jgi:5-methyltetrahydropteroyltriglutamate--homocysteine methyltransferase
MTYKPHTLLPTSLVGSYPQPEWLIDRSNLAGRFPPRVRARELWRVDPAHLEEAQDDATIVAIRDQERAGLDIITDGEIRRESYSNRFATALEGVDIDNPGTALDRSGHPNPVPRITGPIRRKHPIAVRDVTFLRANTDHPIKMTVPGPFTMSQQAQNDFYDDPKGAALDYAVAVNAEIRDLFAAGADVVQIDEPYMQARPDKAREYGLEALNAGCHCQQVSIETAQSNLDTKVLETLPDKMILLGVIDLEDEAVETPDTVAARIRRALAHKDAAQIIVAPDCGMKYLPRERAYAKLEAMVAGTDIVRQELATKAA